MAHPIAVLVRRTIWHDRPHVWARRWLLCLHIALLPIYSRLPHRHRHCIRPGIRGYLHGDRRYCLARAHSTHAAPRGTPIGPCRAIPALFSHQLLPQNLRPALFSGRRLLRCRICRCQRSTLDLLAPHHSLCRNGHHALAKYQKPRGASAPHRCWRLSRWNHRAGQYSRRDCAKTHRRSHRTPARNPLHQKQHRIHAKSLRTRQNCGTTL